MSVYVCVACVHVLPCSSLKVHTWRCMCVLCVCVRVLRASVRVVRVHVCVVWHSLEANI